MRPQRAEGSAGRADALVVAFAARRAIDRGVALGYLEPLLVDRFGAQHQQAVATIITASRQPVRLNDLIAEYDDAWARSFAAASAGKLVDQLPPRTRLDRRGPPRRPAGDQPRRPLPARAAAAAAGEVDQALAETMRLPGARGADDWIAKARRYILRIGRSTRSNRPRFWPAPTRPLSAETLGKRTRDAILRQRTAAVQPARAND